ncbi:MAG: ATP-dependent zinc metalloprotease FtsH [Rikenellaceae bacterium]|nr:ATP-dependent zinc metalloprotease FtsH [Rikenellaceae bacterium]
MAYILIGVLIIGWWAMSATSTPREITWNEVKNEYIDRGDVEKIVVVNERRAEVYLTKSRVAALLKNSNYRNLPMDGPQFTFNVGRLTLDVIKEELQPEQISELFSEEERKSPWTDVVLSFLPFLLIIGLWIFWMRSMNRGAGGGGGSGGVFSVGKAKAQMYDKDSKVKVTFKDVAGLEEAKVEIMEIVDFLKNSKKYSDLGGKIPKGALLVGPPGTGKTLLAKAVAGEADVPFFSISGSDFVEMFVGVGASRVRDLFRQAKEKAPCIVFIDEIDAIGRARSKNAGFTSNDERENTLNQLLTEMDGFGTNAGVIVLAATNRVDILDKALLRAGRFDRQIQVDLPELGERAAIFQVHLKKLKLDPSLDTEFLAKQTPGFSGADIANVCNEAALIAARNNKKQVERQDFLDAIDRIVGGLERRSMVITPEEKRMTAYHEAGHATVSWILEHAHPLLKVTIIPRGRTLGAAWYLPDERHTTTREQFMDEMAAAMGGRAAEMLYFGVLSTGAISDLEKATKAATAMVAYYGMSERIGNISYYDSSGQSDYFSGKPYSEQTAELIDQETKRLTQEAFDRAYAVLQENEAGFLELAQLLLEREVIFTEDVERIFGARKKTPQGRTISEQMEAALERERQQAIEVADALSGEIPKEDSPSAEHRAACRVDGGGQEPEHPTGGPSARPEENPECDQPLRPDWN